MNTFDLLGTTLFRKSVAHWRFVGLVALALWLASHAQIVRAAQLNPSGPTPTAAPISLHSARVALDPRRIQYLAATRAGARIVGVGVLGTIVLSDDGGNTFRQAKSVPIQATLTDVTFADEKLGWAVGHWGTVLMTKDGGENWVLQRHDLSVDQPLFSVHFTNAREGVAVGLWSLLLVTSDGGLHWNSVKLPVIKGGETGDPNLYHVFDDGSGGWFVTAERGTVWHSTDRGATWQPRLTGYVGSLWAGVVLKNGDILVGGLRGAIYASRDGGASWTACKGNTKSSITGLMELPDGTVLGIALDGVRVKSSDGGRTFVAAQLPTRAAFTAAVLDSAGSAVYFSADGILGRQQ